MPVRCDLFCAVIDNYGDLGVCWRLARQLAAEHDVAVTLWVDDLASFAHMAPGLDAAARTQRLGGITVRHWDGDMAEAVPGELIIEGFGCPLPARFVAAMARCQPAPVWLNLDYLSAEDWVEGCHGLVSIDQATGLVRHFWFPGFTAATGGLLREAGLLAARDAFQADRSAQAAFWQGLGIAEADAFSRKISLFSYENAAIEALLDALAESESSTLLLVPAGRALADVARWAGTRAATLTHGTRLARGRLRVVILPFLSHDDYDRLLWACDLNAVRGEDSFVRAQWAARPLLWHIYPQDEGAHLAKLDAFVGRVNAAAGQPAIWATAQQAWNGLPGREVWPALLAELPRLAVAARDWSARLATQPDLATGVMRFYASRVE
ncbi:MAG: elongation factor P maturation arginine rhamnosyltransferase EarP [Moraxellaceae bacterium]|nr:elongation factor P maturation arginine rhamnosyltransferase EarP [Moraxellaceae bacterium]